MFDLDRDYFCRYLSNLDNKKLDIIYRILVDFYESLGNIDFEMDSVFVDILDDVQIPILEECAKRFSYSCNAACKVYEFKNEKEKKNETIN